MSSGSLQAQRDSGSVDEEMDGYLEGGRGMFEAIRLERKRVRDECSCQHEGAFAYCIYPRILWRKRMFVFAFELQTICDVRMERNLCHHYFGFYASCGK